MIAGIVIFIVVIIALMIVVYQYSKKSTLLDISRAEGKVSKKGASLINGILKKYSDTKLRLPNDWGLISKLRQKGKIKL